MNVIILILIPDAVIPQITLHEQTPLGNNVQSSY